ncbi:MAG: hypothetical protein OXR68_05245 [Alphaproteobacteria bacterium]|nr:hypothetical protein [Alphaproteobacteria bacterium]MDD9920009.1 hypothetical protein [Alphaproteobacteria bacterium]
MVLWGHKTIAFLDFWTLEHILSGVSVGMLSIYFSRYLLEHLQSPLHIQNGDFKKSVVTLHITILLMLAFSWEMLEHYLETGLAGEGVEYWFQGVEHWSNRILSDNIAILFGYFLGMRYPLIVWPARIMSITWLYLHIFVFPHSMYLHDIF